MSKAHDPHWRYILIGMVGGPASRKSLRNALIGAARRAGTEDAHLPDLTRFEWPYAIVKVHHHQPEAARAWLPQITWVIEGKQKHGLAVKTLSTSGTIKALTDRAGVLGRRTKA